MLHDRWQRHRKRACQLAHRDCVAELELREQRAPRRVGKRGKSPVERGVLKLNHVVKFTLLACKCQPAMALTLLQEQLEGIVDTGSGAFYGPPAPESH